MISYNIKASKLCTTTVAILNFDFLEKITVRVYMHAPLPSTLRYSLLVLLLVLSLGYTE